MPIIRQQRFIAPAVFSLEDVASQAEAAQERARRAAREILAQAEAQGRALIERSRREGFEIGLAEGRSAALEQLQREAREKTFEQRRTEFAALVKSLNSTLAAFERDKRGMLAAAETGVIELALAIAQRVCKHRAAQDGAVALANARSLLDCVRSYADPELRLNPVDHALLEKAAPADFAQLRALQHVKIVADETVPIGGAILSARDGRIDASIETQLERVAQCLLGPVAPAAGASAEELS